MLAEYKRNTNIGVCLGIIGEIVGRSLSTSGDAGLDAIVFLASFERTA